MIAHTLKSKRPQPKPKWYPSTHQNWTHTTPSMVGAKKSETFLSGSGMSLFDISIARDKVIKEMSENLPYKVGDICQPATIADRENYGDKIRVDKICHTYAQWDRRRKWPDNNHPLIVRVLVMDTGEFLDCSPGWIEAKK